MCIVHRPFLYKPLMSNPWFKNDTGLRDRFDDNENKN